MGEGGDTFPLQKGTFQIMDILNILMVMMVSEVYIYAKFIKLYSLNVFTVQELYPNKTVKNK